jgi:serine/threonine protein kinase
MNQSTSISTNPSFKATTNCSIPSMKNPSQRRKPFLYLRQFQLPLFESCIVFFTIKMEKDHERHDPPSKFRRGSVIDHYRLERLIGKGGYGVIYVAKDLNDGSFCALKIEKKHSKLRGLAVELQMFVSMKGSPYVPALIGSGSDEEHRWIAMELMGPSMTVLRWEFGGSRFSKYSGFLIADEMLKCIQACHESGWVHRDIKPGNFLLRGGSEHPIVIVDFGLSRCYLDPQSGEVLNPRHSVGFVGTSKYASIRSHEGKEQCRADDLIGWFYTMVELVKGDLPWPVTRNRAILLKAKRRTSIGQLCRNLPPECLEMFNYIDSLDYYDRPDYDRIHFLLNAARESCKQHRRLDWEKLRSDRIKRISPIDFRREDGEEVRVFNKGKDVDGPVVAFCAVA